MLLAYIFKLKVVYELNRAYLFVYLATVSKMYELCPQEK